MSKEEPAWRAELEKELAVALNASAVRDIGDRAMAVVAVLPPVWAAIRAAEQRGFQAGVNKTGDSVGRLRAELKTAREDARREAAAEIREEIRAAKAAGVLEPDKDWAASSAADHIDPDVDSL